MEMSGGYEVSNTSLTRGMMSSGIFVSIVRKTSSKIVLLEFVKKMVLSMVKVWFSFVV